MSVLTSTNGDGIFATFVVREVGVEEEPCVVSAKIIGCQGISSTVVK